MAHRIETAKTGRASCRTCRQPIEKGQLRFGEEVASQFSEEPSVAWHHLPCAAKKKPHELKSALASYDGEVPDRAALDAAITEAESKIKPALPYAEHAPTGRARCLSCSEPIAKGELRIAIEREVDTGMMTTTGAGYLHPKCASLFVGDPDLSEQVKKNSRLPAEVMIEVEQALAS